MWYTIKVFVSALSRQSRMKFFAHFGLETLLMSLVRHNSEGCRTREMANYLLYVGRKLLVICLSLQALSVMVELHAQKMVEHRWRYVNCGNRWKKESWVSPASSSCQGTHVLDRGRAGGLALCIVRWWLGSCWDAEPEWLIGDGESPARTTCRGSSLADSVRLPSRSCCDAACWSIWSNVSNRCNIVLLLSIKGRLNFSKI